MGVSKTFIKALMGWGRWPNGKFHIFALHIYEKMLGNPYFPNPPVDLAVFKAALDRFQSLMAEASYGDSRIVVQRDQLRSEIDRMLRQLGHHAEDYCEQDIYIFRTSGFEEVPSSPAPPKPLDPTRILGVEHVMKTVLKLKIKSLGRAAKHYRVAFAPEGTATDPDTWPSVDVTAVRGGVVIENLTPGIVYVFQVKVFGRLGFSDWSPAVTKMCT
jgi:hypothetical protein